MTDEFAETYAAGDTLVVSLGAPNLSWTLTVELATGHARGTRRIYDGPSEEIEVAFEGSDLQLLRDTASDIYMEGDTEYREQFAYAGVGFTATFDDESITASYGVEGRLPDHEAAYDLVSKRVLEAD